jgi:hypothetical protein
MASDRKIMKQHVLVAIVVALTICEEVVGKLPPNSGSSSFSAGFNNKNNRRGAINNSDDKSNAEQQVARDQLYTALANLAANVISGWFFVLSGIESFVLTIGYLHPA